MGCLKLTYRNETETPFCGVWKRGEGEKEFKDPYDFGWRMYDPTIARWNKIDNHAENYYSYSPYNFVINNPVNVIDPDGNDIYILTWFSKDGETGHAGIAIDNYKTVEKKDENGNTIYDENGNAVTEQVKDGTVTYFDLWPNDPVGRTELQDDVAADYTEGRVMTLDALQNTDPTDSRDGNVSAEGRKADGIVQISTTADQDATAKSTANGLVSGNGAYNACTNNCSTFTQNVLNSVFPNVDASQQVRPSGALRLMYDDASVVAPNNLYNAALKVKGAKRVRGPKQAEAKPYLEYFGKSNRD